MGRAPRATPRAPPKIRKNDVRKPPATLQHQIVAHLPTCMLYKRAVGSCGEQGAELPTQSPEIQNIAPLLFSSKKTRWTHARHRGTLLGTYVGDPERSLRSRSTQASKTGHGVILPHAHSEVLGDLEMPPTRRAPRVRPLVAKYPFRDCVGRAHQAKRRWAKNMDPKKNII